MKTKLAISMALMAALSTFGATSNASELNSDNGIVNHSLRAVILRGVESHGGAEVLDGRVEVIIDTNELGQLGASITQKDWTGAGWVIAKFSAVKKTLPDSPGAPDLTFVAQENGKEFSLTVWADHNAEITGQGKLVFIIDGERRELEVRCDM